MASSPRIEELRKKFEENPRRYFAPLANEYRKAGDVQQAIAICREYLPQQPGHMSGHIVFGQALYEARSFEEARAVFETALSLDPENLIALRHLGDIALITGDSENARTWYKRVLEADPRNEEIQAQLATIDQAAASAPTPAISPAVPAATATASPTPAAVPATPSPSAPTVVMKAVHPPAAPPAPVTATSPTAEVTLDAIMPPAPGVAPTPASAPPPPIHDPGPAPLEGLEGTSAAGADAQVSSFSLDGLETTSLSTDASSPAPVPLADLDFGPAGAAPPAPPPPPLTELDFGPAGAPPAPAAEPAAEMAALPDLDFTPPPAAPLPPAPSSPAPPTVEVPAIDLDGPLDLEISLPGAPAPVSAAPISEQPAAPPLDEIAIPVSSVGEPAQASAEQASAAQPNAEPPSSSPLMTETMAELYVQQGHREEALRVYRALLEQRTGDAALQARLAELEAELEAERAPPPTAPRPAGPTMRDLLVAIATCRPGYRPEWPADNGAQEPAAPAPAMEPAMEPPPTTMPAGRVGSAPGRESRADSLGLALSFAAPSAADEAAAHVLARAFRQNGHAEGAPLIEGEPARPAADDLSLRTVFRSEAPAPAPSSFSFDQFFSQRASADHTTQSAPQGQAAESPEEVARFTQWLEGLKKR